MRCPGCGHNNPDDDRFCGICGEALPLSAAPETNFHEDAEVAAAASPRVSTPVVASEGVRINFRAVVDEPARVEQEFTFGLPAAERERNRPPENADSQYPFDDEVQTSRFAKYVSLIALLILGVLIVKEWRPLKQQITDALGFAFPASQPATAPISQPAPAPVQDAAGGHTAGDGSSPAQTGQPQASLPAQPAPRKARPVAAVRNSPRSQRGKAFKRHSGQPQSGRRRRTRARPLISAGRQPGY